VNAVAAAVIQLAERPEVRRRLAEGGHTVYAEVGSASAQFDHAERIYAELIARLRPGA
jgi:hypothetical protein